MPKEHYRAITLGSIGGKFVYLILKKAGYNIPVAKMLTLTVSEDKKRTVIIAEYLTDTCNKVHYKGV